MATTASKADPSCSNTTIATMRAYHVLKVDGYLRTFNNYGGTPSYNSCLFHAGGHNWQIGCYPKGTRKGTRKGNLDCISLYLHLVDVVDEAVTVEATFSLLDEDWKPVPSYSRTTRITFSKAGSYGYERFIKRKELEESEHLQDDCFAVRVDVHIVKEVPSIVMPPSDMHQDLGDLLSSKEHTDVEFLVDGETFAAHRLLLEARSPVLREELFGRIKESTTTNMIQIYDIEAKMFGALLTFVYTDACPVMECEEESVMSQRLLMAADRYDLQRLKLMCEHRLCKHIDKSSVATLLALAENHHCPVLKEACFDFLGSTTNLLAVLETKEFESLALTFPTITKEIISNAVTRNLEKANNLKTEEFERLAQTWPTMTKGLVAHVLTHVLEKEKELGWNQERFSVIKPST